MLLVMTDSVFTATLTGLQGAFGTLVGGSIMALRQRSLAFLRDELLHLDSDLSTVGSVSRLECACLKVNLADGVEWC